MGTNVRHTITPGPTTRITSEKLVAARVHFIMASFSGSLRLPSEKLSGALLRYTLRRPGGLVYFFAQFTLANRKLLSRAPGEHVFGARLLRCSTAGRPPEAPNFGRNRTRNPAPGSRPARPSRVRERAKRRTEYPMPDNCGHVQLIEVSDCQPRRPPRTYPPSHRSGAGREVACADPIEDPNCATDWGRSVKWSP